MNKEIVEKCYGTATKIVGMITELGYSRERKPSYENELRDLIAIEIQRNTTAIATAIYNDIAFTPIKLDEETHDNSTA